jgi:hypothetical protein
MIPQQERKVLNEGIENSFIDASEMVARIKTYNQTGRGAIIDLYEDFYFYISLLYELTSDLDEMKDASEAAKEMKGWLDINVKLVSEKDFKEHCDAGMAAFQKYKVSLSKNGLLALPSRGR